MSRLLPTFLGTLLCCATASQAADPRSVGEAVVIKNQVTAAEAQKDKRRLAKGDAVREQELLEAQAVSHGEFRLADDTKLALGPNARLVLDKFVYDPDKTSKQVLINFAIGSFRFISSSKDPTGYELKTPTATMGVRGTVFDFYIADKGAMVVLMHKGAVEVCAVGCKLHSRLGHLAYVTRSGKVILRRYWDRKLLPGVSIKQAFPFLGKKLAIDDVIRFAILTAPLKAASGKQAANAAMAPAVTFNLDGTISFSGLSAASAGQPSSPSPGGGGGSGPGNGNGNSPNTGNGGGNVGGSGPGTGNGGSNNGGGNG